MKNTDKFLSIRKEKVTSSERHERKMTRRLEKEAIRADELFGPEEEREKARQDDSV